MKEIQFGHDSTKENHDTEELSKILKYSNLSKTQNH